MSVGFASTIVGYPTATKLTCLPYRKPKERHGPPRYPDPITLIGTISDQAKDETDKASVLLRMLSRWTIELPVFTNKVQQVMPFWTGFYKLFSVHKRVIGLDLV
jgi:hypothetical protein